MGCKACDMVTQPKPCRVCQDGHVKFPRQVPGVASTGNYRPCPECKKGGN